MNNMSELEIIQKLPYDLQIELVENKFRKDWTQSEKAEIQKLLREQLQKGKTPGARTDLKETTTSAKHLTQVNPKDTRVNSQIGKLFKESNETVRKRDEIYDEIKKNPHKYRTIKDSLESGKTTISTAHKIITKPKRNAPNGIMTKGVFDVILADVPIAYDDKGGREQLRTIMVQCRHKKYQN